MNFLEDKIPMLLALLEARKTDTVLHRLASLYTIEILVFCIFWSLHVIPGAFLEFESCDGYDLLRYEFCLSALTISGTFS